MPQGIRFIRFRLSRLIVEICKTFYRPRTDGGFWEAFGRRGPSRYGDAVRRQKGFVEEHELLDQLTSDIQAGANGANGFRAFHALLVTWERMAFGGAPRIVDPDNFDEAKKWVHNQTLPLAVHKSRVAAKHVPDGHGDGRDQKLRGFQLRLH